MNGGKGEGRLTLMRSWKKAADWLRPACPLFLNTTNTVQICIAAYPHRFLTNQNELKKNKALVDCTHIRRWMKTPNNISRPKTIPIQMPITTAISKPTTRSNKLHTNSKR